MYSTAVKIAAASMGVDLDKMEQEYRSKLERDHSNPVDSPRHYTNSRIDCIDAMLDTQGLEAVRSFCICNAFKYIWRHNTKNGLEDIKKARWYLDKYIELSERK